MAIKRLQQIVAIQETQPADGVAAGSLFVVANTDLLVKNPTLTYAPEVFRRDDLNLSDLEPLQPLAGVVLGEGSFEMEMTGRTGTLAPTWSIILQACGYREVATEKLTPATITSGPLHNGEVITQAVSGATATVLHDTYDGAGKLLIYDRGATSFDAVNVVTGADSAATFTPGGVEAADGFGWINASIPTVSFLGTPSIDPFDVGDVLVNEAAGVVVTIFKATSGTGAQTIEVRLQAGLMVASQVLTGAGGTITLDGTPAFVQPQLGSLTLGMIEDATGKVLFGARGSVRFSARRGEPFIFTFGGWAGIPQAPVDQGSIIRTSYSQVVPAAFLGVGFDVGLDSDADEAAEHTPRVLSVSLDHGSTIAVQEDATAATGLRGAAEHTSRSATGELEIQVQPEALFAWLETHRGGDPFRMRITYGSGSNLFQLTSPGATIERERQGDQGGYATRNLQLNLSSRRQDGTDSPASTIVLSYTNQ